MKIVGNQSAVLAFFVLLKWVRLELCCVAELCVLSYLTESHGTEGQVTLHHARIREQPIWVGEVVYCDAQSHTAVRIIDFEGIR